MCVGLVQIPPGEFWGMTFADALIKVRGYYLNLGYRSADFRAIFTLLYNLNSKSKKRPEMLWKLNIDTEFKKEYSEDEIRQRNKMVKDLIK